MTVGGGIRCGQHRRMRRSEGDFREAERRRVGGTRSREGESSSRAWLDEGRSFCSSSLEPLAAASTLARPFLLSGIVCDLKGRAQDQAGQGGRGRTDSDLFRPSGCICFCLLFDGCRVTDLTIYLYSIHRLSRIGPSYFFQTVLALDAFILTLPSLPRSPSSSQVRHHKRHQPALCGFGTDVLWRELARDRKQARLHPGHGLR
jgi:hypothetical protein